MSYLRTFRAEANERLLAYRNAEDEPTARKEFLNWACDKQLESHRNGKNGVKSTDAKKA